MQTDAVSGTTTSIQSGSQVNNPMQLDKDAFLKLLVAQLQNQDPMSPMDSNQFISQMAEFSTVEQLANIYQTLDQMARENELIQGAALVGRQVVLTQSDGSTVSGAVQKVALVNNNVCLYLNGSPYDISLLSEVDQESD